MDKFISFRKQKNYGFHVLLFLFIAAVNIVMLLISEPLEELGYRSWVFYLVSVLFFIFPEKNIPAKLIKLACGAVMGCVMAYAAIMLYVGPLSGLGAWGIIIPIVACLALLFLAGPIIPLCFNVCAFAYFTVSFVVAEEAVTNIGPNIAFSLLGVLVLCGGYSLLVRLYYGRDKNKPVSEKVS